ncbi:MAG: DUF5320 domain-containing protein [Fibrobacteres bacterium]|nr:DUF5320 domain-containing protein [Fibrobacterota bacterium]
MPCGDRTGPEGKGPMTGRKAGLCTRNSTPGTMRLAQGNGYGVGRGLGRGRGKGLGLGMAFRHGQQDISKRLSALEQK